VVKGVLCFSSFRAMRRKDVNRLLVNVVAIAIVLFGILTVAVPTPAQTSQPAGKEAIALEIKGYAERHVENDTSMQTGTIIELYRDNKVGLTSREIATIYETEYDRLKKAKESNILEQLNLSEGWIVALVLGILLVFRDVLTEWISNSMKAIASWVYNRFSGTALFHKFSLKRYRLALREKYRQLHVPFRSTRPLQMQDVYVPLKVAGTSDTKQIDAHEAVNDYRKLMVTGPPGSGKSMLLKHIALRYADGLLDLPEQPIAILLEMHRLSDPEKSLKQHLVEALERDDFPHAEKFVTQGLKRGRLMLLLDGLDEVNSDERPRVVREIRDLLDYMDEHRCRVIITCRTAIYEGQFSDRVEQTLEVVEFSDRQIRQFLQPWVRDMPENKSIEQLMKTLHDRPRIMALARNPLLLTIIAYLYTDTPFVLPHSRAEFYQKATDILLDVWHREHNLYSARDKRSLLQHLALYFQDNANRQRQDRRSVDYRQVLPETAKVLPDLNLNPEDVQPVLKEIVERSGLFLEIDGGDRYQFSHLTLQEFFAATALRGNGEELLDRFEKKPDVWRETAKLWCGLAEDSTTAIEKIYAKDSITAFECLADAQKVNQELAAQIIDTFKKRLLAVDRDNRIVKAFAAVAADNRPRGLAVFEFLEETLIADEFSARRAAAADILSLTNLPNAAQMLASYDDKPTIPVLSTHEAKALKVVVREYLIRMGDLAVPVLTNLSAGGSERAMDALVAIGTPDAAEAFVPLLWSDDDSLAVYAAWRLAALLPQPNVEEVLRNYAIAEEQRKANSIKWIWEPFDEPSDSALPVITARLAYLMANSRVIASSIDFEEQPKLDPRIVVPLCAIEIVQDINFIAIDTMLNQYDGLKFQAIRLSCVHFSQLPE